MKSIRVNCEYLNYLYNEGEHFSRNIKQHTHHFWHLDCFISEPVTINKDDGTAIIDSGGFCIIPADVQHGFIFSSLKVSILSIYFQVETMLRYQDALVVSMPDSVQQNLLNIISNCIQRDNTRPTEKEKLIIEKSIEALLISCQEEFSGTSVEDDFLFKVEDFVDKKQGKHVGVAELAAKLFLSTSRFSAKFKERSGISVKQFLDEKRCDYTKRLLRFSPITISDIAMQTGFDDIYSFSHFFKRVTGSSPSQYRNQS